MTFPAGRHPQEERGHNGMADGIRSHPPAGASLGRVNGVDALQPPPFEITSQQADGAVTVAVRGELDLAVDPQLRVALEGATDGDRTVVLDLRECPFMDSTALGTMLRFGSAMGDRLRVVCARGQVLRVLKLTRCDRYLTLVVPEDA